MAMLQAILKLPGVLPSIHPGQFTTNKEKSK
jgi:hypothetical protein